jgi:hypothetical protein
MLVTVADCELVVPTLALTERTFGVKEREGNGSATPAHPEIPNTAANKMQMKSTRTWYFAGKFISIGLRLTQVQFF